MEWLSKASIQEALLRQNNGAVGYKSLKKSRIKKKISSFKYKRCSQEPRHKAEWHTSPSSFPRPLNGEKAKVDADSLLRYLCVFWAFEMREASGSLRCKGNTSLLRDYLTTASAPSIPGDSPQQRRHRGRVSNKPWTYRLVISCTGFTKLSFQDKHTALPA